MNRIVVVSFALAVVLLLPGCGCLPFIPRVVACYDQSDAPPMALRFQKRGQFGRTDYNQRKEDMIECGIPREQFRVSLAAIEGIGPGETIEQVRARREKFLQCIEAKDYVWLGLKECGPMKERRGICK